jgi:hypothetical protein
MLPVIAVLVGVWYLVTQVDYAGPEKLIISKETTYLTGPLNPDGTVNYVEAIDRELRKGVTKENNAFPLLLQAVGPDLVGQDILEEVCNRLEIDLPPRNGHYFVAFADYVKSMPRGDLPAAFRSDPDAADNRLLEAMQRPWSGEEYPILAAWLDRNGKPLAIATAACERPRFYIPLVSTSDPPSLLDVDIGPARELRSLGRALRVRAMHRLHAGDNTGARADLLTAHRIARLTGQGWSTIMRLVAVATERTAGRGDIILTGKLSAKEARTYLAELNRLAPFPGGRDLIDRCERLLFLDGIMTMVRSVRRGDSPRGFPPEGGGDLPTDLTGLNAALKEVNAWYDRMARFAAETHHPKRRMLAREFHADWAAFEQSTRKEVAELRSIWGAARSLFSTRRGLKRRLTRLVVRLLMFSMMPAIRRAVDVHDIAAARLSLAKASVALAAYRAEEGEFPDRLEALVPGVLKAVPMDVWSGRPLVYRRTKDGYVLYSVGENLTDDGGAPGAGEHGDVVVQFPPQER